VDIYFCALPTAALTAAEAAGEAALRKEACLARLPEERRRETLCASLLARRCVSALTGEREVRFSRGPRGKPLCAGGWCSASHSGGLAAACAAAEPVGLDVERLRAVPSRLLRALTAGESAFVRAGEAGWEGRFWRLWTMKEALLKCRGDGVGAVRKTELLPQTLTADSEDLSSDWPWAEEAAPIEADGAVRTLASLPLWTLPGHPEYGFAFPVAPAGWCMSLCLRLSEG